MTKPKAPKPSPPPKPTPTRPDRPKPSILVEEAERLVASGLATKTVYHVDPPTNAGRPEGRRMENPIDLRTPCPACGNPRLEKCDACGN